MRIKIILIILIVVCLVAKSYSQHVMLRIDSSNVLSANRFGAKLLGLKIDTCNYLCLTLAENVLVIYRHNCSYKILRAVTIFDVKSQQMKINRVWKKTIHKSVWLTKCFDEAVCNPLYKYVGDDSTLIQNLSHTGYFYFVMYKSGLKKCEFNVPTMLSGGSERRNWIPMDTDIFVKLLGLIYKLKVRT